MGSESIAAEWAIDSEVLYKNIKTKRFNLSKLTDE